MNKSVFFALLLAFASISFSQEFRVKSMLELTHDLSARTSPRLDNSGTECAIIRINIPSIKDVLFQSPIVGDPVHAPGEHTVYVPANSEKLSMICDNKTVDIVFSDYDITLQPKSCYRIVLSKESASLKKTGYVNVNVAANYDDDILLIDGIPMGQLPLLVDNLSVGKHTFAVPNTMGRVLNDTVINITAKISSINLFLREGKFQFVSLGIPNVSGLEGYDICDNEILWGVNFEERNGKQGMVDYAGNVIIPFQYDYIDPRQDIEDYYWVKRDGKHGVYSISKGEIVPCNYSCGSSIPYYYGNGLFKVPCLGLYDIKSRRLIIPFNYSAHNNNIMELIADKYVITSSDDEDNIKVFNIHGDEIISVYNDRFPNLYKDLCLFSSSAYDLNSGNLAWTLPKGQRIVHSLSRHEVFEDGIFKVWDKNTRKIGYIDEHANIIIPIIYKDNDRCYWHAGIIVLETTNNDTVVISRDGNIIASTELGSEKHYKHLQRLENGKILCVNDNNEYGVINSTGSAIFPFTSDSIAWHERFQAYFIYKPTGEIMVRDYAGKVIIPFTSDLISEEDYGYYFINKPTGETMVMDSKGNVIIPFTKDSIGTFYDVCIIHKPDGSKMVVNSKGNTFLPICEQYYDDDISNRDIDYIIEKGNHIFGNFDSFKIIDANGKCVANIPVTNAIYNNTYCPGNLLIICCNNKIRLTKDDRLFQIINKDTKKYGFISSNGELLTSCIYDEIINMFDLTKYEEDGVADYYSEKINSFTASEGYGIVGIGGRYGFINTSGKVVVPLIYTAVTPFLNGVAYVRDKNNKWTKIYSKDLK